MTTGSRTWAPPLKFLDPLGYPDPLVVLMGLSLQLKAFTHLPVSPCLHSPLSESVFFLPFTSSSSTPGHLTPVATSWPCLGPELHGCYYPGCLPFWCCYYCPCACFSGMQITVSPQTSTPRGFSLDACHPHDECLYFSYAGRISSAPSFSPWPLGPAQSCSQTQHPQ